MHRQCVPADSETLFTLLTIKLLEYGGTTIAGFTLNLCVPAAVQQASNVEKLPGKGSAGFTLNSCVHSLVYLCQ